MELFNDIIVSLPAWLGAIAALLVALKGIAVLTPTPKDDDAIGKALAFVHKLISVVTLTKQEPKKDVDKD